MFALTAVATTSLATPVLLKAASELHHSMVLQSNILARQGAGLPELEGEGERLAKQRAGGIKGGIASDEPGYMRKVPSKSVAGDTRGNFKTGGLGNATSSRGNITDILSKVPRRVYGTEDYKRINRPTPRRLPGYGNQSYPQ